MSSMQTAVSSSDKKHYRVRKEIAWLIATILFLGLGKTFYEYWNHLNWPPYQGSNKSFISSLECERKLREKNYNVSQEMLDGDVTGKTFHPLGYDRSLFFDHPECAAVDYLFYEGSGIKLKYSIFDMRRKLPTAHVEISFERND